MFWGSLTRLGLVVALAGAAIDQASKLWLIYVFDLAARAPVRLTPFLDLVLVWNKGISYGLFPQEGPVGKWVLVTLKIVAVVLLWVWLARTHTRLTAVSLGLIIAGAVGNAVDRLFHITTESFHFSWYVFNLADAAIVAGVIGLLYDSFVGDGAVKAP